MTNESYPDQDVAGEASPDQTTASPDRTVIDGQTFERRTAAQTGTGGWKYELVDTSDPASTE